MESVTHNDTMITFTAELFTIDNICNILLGDGIVKNNFAV